MLSWHLNHQFVLVDLKSRVANTNTSGGEGPSFEVKASGAGEQGTEKALQVRRFQALWAERRAELPRLPGCSPSSRPAPPAGACPTPLPFEQLTQQAGQTDLYNRMVRTQAATAVSQSATAQSTHSPKSWGQD